MNNFLKNGLKNYGLNIYEVDSIQVVKMINRNKNLNDLLNGI